MRLILNTSITIGEIFLHQCGIRYICVIFRCEQLEKDIEKMSAAMSQAIGSVDHIPSQADYVNLRDDLAFREVIIFKHTY